VATLGYFGPQCNFNLYNINMTTKNRQIVGERRKYCNDHKLSHTAQHINTKYNQLTNALPHHWPGSEINILPMVMTRTGTPHTSTIAILTSLITLRRDPTDKIISKARPETTRILSHFHLHIVKWLLL
jgi:hypothetical protein